MTSSRSESDYGVTPLGEAPPEERLLFGLGDPPAYLRRGMSVEDAEARVDKRCATARDEMLYAVRLRLRFWNRLVSDSGWLRRRLSPAAQASVADIGSKIFSPGDPMLLPAPVGWGVFAAKHWRAFAAAVEDFNDRWQRFLRTFPLDDLRHAIDGYNRYYVLEKECAVRSALTARRGFMPRDMPTVDDLMARFPLLPAPPGDYR